LNSAPSRQLNRAIMTIQRGDPAHAAPNSRPLAIPSPAFLAGPQRGAPSRTIGDSHTKPGLPGPRPCLPFHTGPCHRVASRPTPYRRQPCPAVPSRSLPHRRRQPSLSRPRHAFAIQTLAAQAAPHRLSQGGPLSRLALGRQPPVPCLAATPAAEPRRGLPTDDQLAALEAGAGTVLHAVLTSTKNICQIVASEPSRSWLSRATPSQTKPQATAIPSPPGACPASPIRRHPNHTAQLLGDWHQYGFDGWGNLDATALQSVDVNRAHSHGHRLSTQVEKSKICYGFIFRSRGEIS
jgi:hypothetical protein